MRDQDSSIPNYRRSSVRVPSLLLVAGLATTLILTACSSSSSSSGVGINFTRTWSGVMRSNATNQTFPLRVQLVQSSLDSANGIQTSTLAGTAIVGQNSGDCIVGGVLEGTTTGASVVMTFGGNTYSGAVRSNGLLEGLWSSDGSNTTTTPTTTPTTDEGDDAEEDPVTDETATLASCSSFDSGDFSLQ